MTSIAFQSGRVTPFSSGAAQQHPKPRQPDGASANDECGCTDTAQAYATRGVIYGLLVSAPLWLIIGGAVVLACWTMG
jgi:hypothetical protein